jgi:hypothetical protein
VIIATNNAASDSVIDRVGIEATEGATPELPALPSGDLTPPAPTPAPEAPPAAD